MELSKAFGLKPTGKRGSGFTDGPLRKNNVGLFVGSSCVGGINDHRIRSINNNRIGGENGNGSGTGGGGGEGHRVNPVEDGQQRRQEGNKNSALLVVGSSCVGGINNNRTSGDNGNGGDTGGGDRQGRSVNPFEDGEQRRPEGKKNSAPVVGRSCVGGINDNRTGGENGNGGGGTGDGDGEGRRVNPFECSQQHRFIQEGGVARPVQETVKPSFLDTLDRLMGFRGTMENNFSQSITSSGGLAAASPIDPSKKRKGEDHNSTQKNKKNNEIYISESSDEGGGDGHEGCEGEEEVEMVVFNPLFVGNLTKPAVSKKS